MFCGESAGVAEAAWKTLRARVQGIYDNLGLLHAGQQFEVIHRVQENTSSVCVPGFLILLVNNIVKTIHAGALCFNWAG